MIYHVSADDETSNVLKRSVKNVCSRFGSLLYIKLSPLYEQLHLLKLNNIYQLEVLKFVCKFKIKALPKSFENYFQLASQVHIYLTRFAANEHWSVPRFKKIYTQRLIKYKGTKSWNVLPTDLRDNYLKITLSLSID